jgi:hypothetical protein
LTELDNLKLMRLHKGRLRKTAPPLDRIAGAVLGSDPWILE